MAPRQSSACSDDGREVVVRSEAERMAAQRNTAPKNGRRFEAFSTKTIALPCSTTAARSSCRAAGVERVR
jgi:hypothetical protein